MVSSPRLSCRCGIGLLGGTFDPVHEGHLALADAALKAFSLERIEFLPAGNPWQKHPISPASDRLQMLKLALAGRPRFAVNPCELNRPGATYTIDTLREIRSQLPSDVPLVLILGADQWENLQTWKQWKDFLGLVNIAVSTRNGKIPKACPEVLSWSADSIKPIERLCEHPHGSVAFFSMEPFAASSSKIRTILRSAEQNQNEHLLDVWLNPSVKAYILTRNLYSKNE